LDADTRTLVPNIGVTGAASGYPGVTFTRHGEAAEFDVDEVLDRATQLFWTRGYEATSVQDLVDTLGVNRASLYATFGDKAQLFEAVLHRYGERVNGALTEVLAPPATGAAAVRAWFKVLIEQATQPGRPRGCLMLNTLTGCATAPERLMDRVVAGVRSSTDRLHEALARDRTWRAGRISGPWRASLPPRGTGSRCWPGPACAAPSWRWRRRWRCGCSSRAPVRGREHPR
jgi:TetR/AcrR family transcriptional repressor of nem operon